MTELAIEIANLEATTTFGHRLGAMLLPGDVIGLTGPLGAGKTHLVRAIAEGLEIPDSRCVNSPTFVLIQEYRARLPIYHFDVYRLRRAEEFSDLGVDEYFGGKGVCLIEWVDRVIDYLPAERLIIRIEPVLENADPSSQKPSEKRRFLLVASGKRYSDLLGKLNLGSID
jgi:tRNA threonylcarbamoyladenosine biosynthesis protein TsaE